MCGTSAQSRANTSGSPDFSQASSRVHARGRRLAARRAEAARPLSTASNNLLALHIWRSGSPAASGVVSTRPFPAVDLEGGRGGPAPRGTRKPGLMMRSSRTTWRWAVPREARHTRSRKPVHIPVAPPACSSRLPGRVSFPFSPPPRLRQSASARCRWRCHRSNDRRWFCGRRRRANPGRC